MSRQDIGYRPIVPNDLFELRAAHQALFPIDYESHFYNCVIHSRDQIFSWAAVCKPADTSEDATLQQERLIGFVTARTFRLYDCSMADRACMGLESRICCHTAQCHTSLSESLHDYLQVKANQHDKIVFWTNRRRLLDQEDIIYILTLGVTEQYRHLGVASQLIHKVIQYAQSRLCRAVYLHVVDYNQAALNLYARNSFHVLATLRNFYHIETGRQPDPNRTSYDAYLYAFLIDVSLNASPLAFFSATCAPVRSLLGQLQSCMPWAQRQSNYFSQAVRQRNYGPIKPSQGQSQQHGSLWRLFNKP